MDKNTLLGLLLMGAVIFGFVYLNQPSPEEIEKQRQERLAAEAAKAEAETAATLAFDTISAADVEMLRTGISLYGSADTATVPATYTYKAPDVDLILRGDSITGSVSTPAGTVPAAKILANNTASLDRQTVAAATRILHRVVTDLGRYKNFARHLSGDSTVTRIENDVLALNVTSKGGQISRVELKNYDCYLNRDTTNVVLWNGDNNSYSFTLTSSSQRFETRDFYFTPVQENDSTLLMKLDLGAGSWWGIRYSLRSESYAVRMDVVQHGMAQAGVIPPSVSTMELNWHQKLRRNEEGRMFEERNSAIYYKLSGGDVEDLSPNSDTSKEVNNGIKWIGFKNQFFSSVLIADGKFNNANLVSVDLSKDPDFLKDMTAKTQVNYSASRDSVAGFNFYLGPNLYPLLSSLDKSISPDEDLEMTRLIPLGWSLFRWINTIIVIPVFNFLGQYISNYGIIILLLTLFIKVILLPFTYKSYMSQAKMRVLAPEIKEINDKYPGKENAMVRQQKTMELYSKAGASPFSGCLPMLLQLPILVAMFSFFPSCIELRGEPFLWAHDLSAPDAIYSWDINIPLISSTFGNHISLFCLLMTITNIIYTRISMQNQPTSSGMPGMKMMMYLMPLLFLFWFNNYASGLSYYYFLFQIITIGQTYLFRRFVDEKKVRATMLENAKKPRKKSGLMARLEEAQRQQQALMREQQKRQGKRR